MNFRFKMAAAAILAVSLAASYAQTSEANPPAKKHIATKKAKASAEAKKAAEPTVEEQIQALRHDLEGQINGLKSTLSEKDAQLQRAQQAAADAQAAAAKAEAAAAAQQQAVSDNAAAVSTLQTTVTDLKGNQASLATTVSDETAKIKKEIGSPNALHYKGITLTPGGFMAAETVFRQKATGADLPTALSSIPFDGANTAALSEFYGSGRQSRISLLAEGKTDKATYRGYFEADFLGSGTTSNNNQSNSYVLRQRAVWAQALLKNGISFQGGQMWSLAAERAKGLSNFSGDIKTPLGIDPNYVPGFVWNRQYGFAVIKNGEKVSYGISLENAQTIAGNSCPTSSVTSGTTTTTYASCLFAGSGTDGATSTSNVSSGVQSSSYNALNGTYSYNLGPDIISKIAVDPGKNLGHYEFFAIGRFPHYEVYPNYATQSDAGRFTDSLPTGGFGGSLRAPVFGKYGDLGLSGLYGWGVGRYGDTTLSDVVFDANGRMKALTNVSGLASVELHPTKRVVVYYNFGEDFAGRLDSLAAGTGSGYGLLNVNNTGCNVESALPTSGSLPSSSPANCKGNNKFVQENTVGVWYDFYKGAAGRVRYGVQYSNINRAIWGGTTSPSVEATENQFYTSFRYYLP
jgi:FKBP-type peptidyl-prolyl cis-trans isomerase